jgi:hypothetical protein
MGVYTQRLSSPDGVQYDAARTKMNALPPVIDVEGSSSLSLPVEKYAENHLHLWDKVVHHRVRCRPRANHIVR